MSNGVTSPRSVGIGAPIASVVVAAGLFGTAGTARELGPDEASSLSVGAARIALGTVVLWAVAGARRGRPPVVPKGAIRRARSLVLVGGAGVVLYTPLFFVAVDRAGVAVGTIVTIASGPFFAGGLEWVFRRRPPTVGWFIGTSVTIGGVVLLVSASAADRAGFDMVGVGAALAAGLGYAVYSVTTKVAIEYGLPSTLALAMPFTVGAFGVAAVARGESFAWLTTADGALMALYLGVVATGVAYVLFGAGLSRLTSSTVVTLVLVEPVTAALLATLLLDESIPPVGWLGLAGVVAGLWVVGRAVTPPAHELSPPAARPTLRR